MYLSFLIGKSRKQRCGTCTACLLPDCGKCIFCKDKPKFGGRGLKKQCRKCLNYTTQAEDVNNVVTSVPVPKSKTTLSGFLQTSARKVHSVKGDGNCFFRCISYHLVADEEQYYCIRLLLERFENLNQSLFEGRLVEGVTGQNMTQHIAKLGIPNTHIELMATATLFQVPLYCCMPHHDDTEYSWHIFQPLKPADKIRIPVILSEEPYSSFAKCHHFEITLINNNHYDCVVFKDTEKVCETPPSLSGKTYHIDLTKFNI